MYVRWLNLRKAGMCYCENCRVCWRAEIRLLTVCLCDKIKEIMTPKYQLNISAPVQSWQVPYQQQCLVADDHRYHYPNASHPFSWEQVKLWDSPGSYRIAMAQKRGMSHLLTSHWPEWITQAKERKKELRSYQPASIRKMTFYTKLKICPIHQKFYVSSA